MWAHFYVINFSTVTTKNNISITACSSIWKQWTRYVSYIVNEPVIQFGARGYLPIIKRIFLFMCKNRGYPKAGCLIWFSKDYVSNSTSRGWPKLKGKLQHVTGAGDAAQNPAEGVAETAHPRECGHPLGGASPRSCAKNCLFRQNNADSFTQQRPHKKWKHFCHETVLFRKEAQIKGCMCIVIFSISMAVCFPWIFGRKGTSKQVNCFSFINLA